MDTGGFFVATFEKRADLALAAQMTGAKGTDKEIALSIAVVSLLLLVAFMFCFHV